MCSSSTENDATVVVDTGSDITVIRAVLQIFSAAVDGLVYYVFSLEVGLWKVNFFRVFVPFSGTTSSIELEVFG